MDLGMKIFSEEFSTQRLSSIPGRALSALAAVDRKIAIIASIAFVCFAACVYLLFIKNRRAQPVSKVDFKNNWKTIVVSKSNCEKEARKIKAAYEQSVAYRRAESSGHVIKSADGFDEPLGKIYGSFPVQFGFWMPGVALLASHLTEKKNVEGVFVCRSLEAFATKIHQMALNGENQRAAFILGTIASGYGLEPNFPQHKVTVGVEKKDGVLKFTILDSQPIPGHNEINRENLKDDIWEGYKRSGQFNGLELICRAILKGCQGSLCKPIILPSKVLRQKRYGCAVFALQDALAFMRDPNFFDRIESFTEFNAGDAYHLGQITRLPPEFMVGLQTFEGFEKYQTVEKVNQQLIGRGKSLQAYFDENVLEVGATKPQNMYITKKHFTYLTYLVQALSESDPDKIVEIIGRTLLTTVDQKLFPPRHRMYGEFRPQDLQPDEELDPSKLVQTD